LEGDLDGGSWILSYVILWDEGIPTGAFVPILGYDTPNKAMSVVIDENINSGQLYRFKYYATNTHGDGIESDESEIMASSSPT
jgi:hypothetical protein